MDPRELQATLAWSAVPFVGEKTLRALLLAAREGRQSLAMLWETPVEDLGRLVKLHPKSVAALGMHAEDYWTQAGEDAAKLLGWGVDPLVVTEPEYPATLRALPATGGGARGWPLLFAYGALSLLEEPRVAVVNSQDVSMGGLAITESLADALARRDVPLITSTNREAYKAAAVAAKRHAAASVLVLDRGLPEAFPDGLSREPVAPARVWDEAFDPDLQLLLSPFGWRERWTARSGPRRDALIFDLADLIVAVDVRPGGTMEREIQLAVARGKTVLTPDRGADTPEGTRALWETVPGVRRLPWRSGEGAVQEVLDFLPRVPAETGTDRNREGWLREVGLFLGRACRVLAADTALSGAAGAYPSGSPLARIAASWSPGSDTGRGHAWLLADLCAEGSVPPARVSQLLERVEHAGLLAAVVPAAWLEEERFSGARAEWLREASLRLMARLPAYPGAARSSEKGAAALVLQRSQKASGAVPVFTPDRAEMGRFHLRRYLQEVLAGLSRQ